MRIRSMCATAGTAVMLTVLGTTPAIAGTGQSTWCDNGDGYQYVTVLSSPITVAVEIGQPSANHLVVHVCYGSNPRGQANTVTGGMITAQIHTTTSTVYPGAYVGLTCSPDHTTGFAPSCNVAGSADFALNELAPSTPPSSFCLVSLGSGCDYYVPGVMVSDGDPNRALLQIVVLGTPIDTPPVQCVAVIVACP